MIFGNIEFDINPNKILIEQKRNIVKYNTVTGKEIVSDLGRSAIKISGEGQFYGEKSKLNLLKLKELFKSGGSYLLILPNTEALFVKLIAFTEKSTDKTDVIVYTFEFLEDTQLNGVN